MQFMSDDVFVCELRAHEVFYRINYRFSSVGFVLVENSKRVGKTMKLWYQM